MAFLRSLLLVVIAVAMLPWGAWAGAHLPERPAITAASDGGPDETPILTAAQPECRGKGLIGAPCGPDLGLPPRALHLPALAARGVARSYDPTLKAGRTAGGLLDPPRPC